MTEPRFCGQGNLLTKESYRAYDIEKKKKSIKKKYETNIMQEWHTMEIQPWKSDMPSPLDI